METNDIKSEVKDNTKDLSKDKLVKKAEAASNEQKVLDSASRIHRYLFDFFHKKKKSKSHSIARDKLYLTLEEAKKAAEIIKSRIQTNADNLANRIIDKVISQEEKQAKFAKAEAEAKERAKDTNVTKAKVKKERKQSTRVRPKLPASKTIPTAERIALNKENQDKLALAHAVKREEIEAKLDKKEAFMDMSAKEAEARREARKKKWANAHKQDKTKTVCNAPKAETLRKKALGPDSLRMEYIQFKYEAEKRFKESKVVPNSKAPEKHKAKREAFIKKHPMKLAEHRLDRLQRTQAEEFKTTEKIAKDLAHFKEAQARRDAKKLEVRAKYLTKGKTSPKVKNIETVKPTKVQPTSTKELILGDTYILKLCHNHKDTILPETPIYTEEKLMKRISDIHKYQIEKASKNGYIGVFAYNTKAPNICVKEFLLNDNLEYSRLPKQEEKAA